MKPKPAVLEFILALSVLLAFLLAGCMSTPDERTTTRPWNEPGMRTLGVGLEQGNFRAVAPPSPASREKAQGFAPSFNGAATGGLTEDGSAPKPGQFSQSHSFYSQSEELWVISRPKPVASVYDDQYPSTGSMVVKENEKEIPIPLKHTDVKAKVSGYIASVEVTQQFHNPYDSKIEAVYVFPLPENSAVNEFVMTIGERHIRGIIRERGEAERIYNEARSQGYVASLLSQERPNIFTQSVANIEPGKEIDVNIKYLNTLAYMDGWFEFVFPMAVGPRFNPAGSTKGIGAVARGQQGASWQPTEVSYLRPEERSGHDISLQVEVDAGVAIEEFQCTTHRIVTERPAADKLVATLADSDTVPNRDFVLRYRVAGGEIKAGVLTHRDERGGFFTMMLYPPTQFSTMPRAPLEIVFVLDCSGSMEGRPLAQAKEAIRTALKALRPDDSFQLINFSMSATKLGPRPLAATPENVRYAMRYLDTLNAEGGTMMIEGVKGALEFPHDPSRLRFVCFLTDGFIGNEAEILHEVDKRLGPARIFSFGVGPSVNRYLLDSMARIGRGAVSYLLAETDAAPVMQDFFERVSHPALTDLQIDWNGMDVKEVFPKRTPDLFTGRPILLTGRFYGEPPAFVRVRAREGSQERTLNAPVFFEESSPALATIWARSKIADLSVRAIAWAWFEHKGEIRRTALDFNLLSQFTSFVAVDSTRRTEGRSGTTVPVAVPVPDGVKYRTTVRE